MTRIGWALGAPKRMRLSLMSSIPKIAALGTLAAALIAQERTMAGSGLPGKGLAEHPFLYCGEWDTRKPDQTIFLVRGGKVVWTYSIPIKNEKGELNEFDDIHLLSNNHILFARKTGAAEITME